MKRDIINEEEVKNRIREFRHCCKAYNGWKSEMNEMIVQHHDRIAERKTKEQLITKHSFTSDLCDSYCDQFADDFAETMTFSTMSQQLLKKPVLKTNEYKLTKQELKNNDVHLCRRKRA